MEVMLNCVRWQQKFENVSVGSGISLSHIDNLFTSLSELNILLASDKPQSSSF